MNTTKSSDANSSADGERLVCVVQHPVAQQSYEAIDLEQLVSVIWRRRWRIFIATAAITIAAVGYALLATPYYRAEAVLMARDPKTGFGVSSQLSQFAGLAGLAGINVGSASTQEPLGVLRSKGFARRFIEQNQLLGILGEDSTPLSGKEIRGEVASLDVREAAERFMDSVLEVIDDKRSGLVVVAVTWKDPEVAATWANLLVRQLNDEMRMRALGESQNNIRFLSDQLRNTDVVAIQEAISRVLESEMQKSTFASGNAEYAFRVVDSAEPPHRRVKPKRTLIVLLSCLAGLMLSVFVAAIADPFRRLADAVRNS